LREAHRVLPRLAAPSAYLRAVTGGFGVFVARNRFRKPVTVISDRVMQGLLSRDFVEPAPDDGHKSGKPERQKYRLGPSGVSFLRRLGARGEDRYAAQHRQMEQKRLPPDEWTPCRVWVNEGESPIGWLRRRKGSNGRPLLSDAAFDAAERLREDFTLARLMPRVTTDWNLAPGTAPRRRGPETALAVTDAALAARQRVHDALSAVGPGLSDALLQVCCHLKGLEEAERDLNWPRRSGKLVLAMALDRLAIHYGLTGRET